MGTEYRPDNADGSLKPFRLGAYRVYPQRCVIEGPDGEISLQPKIMEVLCELVRHQGEVLSRAELIDLVWGVEFGGDESLTRAISQLRKAFGDTKEEPRYVETIPKRGYRLLAPVEALQAGAHAAPETLPGLTLSILSRPGTRVIIAAIAAVSAIAILAFIFFPGGQQAPAARTGIMVLVEPFTGDGPAAAAGLPAELSGEIAKSPFFRSRTGSAEMADEPGDGIRFTLHGDMQTVGDRLRVNVQVLDGASGDFIWGETYEVRNDEAFSQRHKLVAVLSREVQLPVLTEVRRRLRQRPIMSLVPWELTLLVTAVPGDDERPQSAPVEDSYWLQKRALELDPDFAPAHALLAQLIAYHALFHPPANTQEALDRARQHAGRALILAPYDAEVLYQLSLYHRFTGDRNEAKVMLERVLELQPTHPLAEIDLAFVEGQCSETGRAIERLRHIEDELSPSNPVRWVANAHLSALYLAEGDYRHAEEAAERSRRIVPLPWTAMTLAAAYAAEGRPEMAGEVLAAHRAEWPQLSVSWFADEITPRWCLGGSRTADVQTAFRTLAEAIEQP